jgi:hypothetical protein
MYFEQQVAALCGQHLLNHLVQRPYFDITYLMNIAKELDAEERTLASKQEMQRGHSEEQFTSSQNISDSGDFSIQVLELALDRAFKLRLNRDKTTVINALKAYDMDPNTKSVMAFVFNLNEHWFCARRMNDQKFYLFNSLDTQPREIKFLTTYCAQLQAEGYSVFLVEGILPPLDAMFDNFTFPTDKMTTTTSSSSQDSQQTNDKKKKMEYFTGTGFSLKKQKDTTDTNNIIIAAAAAAGGEDPELLEAIQASLIEQEKKMEILEEDKDIKPVEVGVQVVLPRTGRRIRRKFPPGSLGKDVFEFVRTQQPEMTATSQFTLIDPLTKTTLLPGSALGKFAPSITFAVEEL